MMLTKSPQSQRDASTSPVRIPVSQGWLEAELSLPAQPRGLVLFVHGSGGSRHGRRDALIAAALRHANFGTLRFDLLTAAEAAADFQTGELRFDVPFLSRRVQAVAQWALRVPAQTADLPLGYLATGTGAAAALDAAAARPALVNAIVGRGAWPHSTATAPAADTLPLVRAPTLLIVGGRDDPAVLDRNRQALALLRGVDKQLKVLPGASHLFAEPGALEAVARLTREWFQRHFRSLQE